MEKSKIELMEKNIELMQESVRLHKQIDLLERDTKKIKIPVELFGVDEWVTSSEQGAKYFYWACDTIRSLKDKIGSLTDELKDHVEFFEILKRSKISKKLKKELNENIVVKELCLPQLL